MLLKDYIDPDKLAAQLKNGMVKRQHHPRLPLQIFNYTQKAQYTPERWDDVTDKCRGLIGNEFGTIIARPFVKFWNYGDPRHPETMPENLPATAPSITRKMDGSLGILYRYDGQWAVATRGSFTSDQALWATKWLREHGDFFWPKGYTPLFEIVYPENQIVVKYDFSGLVLLAVVNNETGEELPRSDLKLLAGMNNVRLVDEFDKPIAACAEEDIENEEGYVATWHRPGTWPLRVKIKMETYCKLHRLLTQTNAVTVWEMLRDGLDVESVTREAPAEFVTWINGVEENLRTRYRAIEDKSLQVMLQYRGERNVETPEQRKKFARYASSLQPLTPILFAMLDGKDYAPIIWKMLRPRGDEKAFKVDEEG